MTVRSRSFVGALALVLVVSLGAAACGGGSSKSASPKATEGPGAPGQYGVGFTSIKVTDAARSRVLDVDVWYPTDKGATGTPARYALLSTAYTDSKVAVVDAPVAGTGKLPLVVYSHGSGGLNFVSSYLTEHLASQGFVVVAANHTGNTAMDTVLGTNSTVDENEFNRPADISATITDMLERSSAATGPFSGRIDADRIGLVGHSYGGYTVLATVTGHRTSLGDVVPDPRVKAVVGLAPYTETMSAAELAADSVPTLLLVGTKDVTTVPATNAEVAYNTVTGRPVELIEMKDAGHQAFTDLCSYLDLIPKMPQAPAIVVTEIRSQAQEGCGAGFMPYDRGIEVTNTVTTAFLLQFVAGDDADKSYWATWPGEQSDLTVQAKLQ